MTHREIKTLDDGTRVYADYQRYQPVAAEDRKYGVRRPEDPRAVRFGSEWLLPIETLAPEERAPIPETRPDTDAYIHRSKPRKCKCFVCQRPEAERWKKRYDAGGRPPSDTDGLLDPLE